MKRLATAGLAILLLWALVPAAGELFENALHLAMEGHAAHAAPDGDDHTPIDTEHGCSGAVHLCSCCASLSCLATTSATIVRIGNDGERLSHLPVRAAVTARHGVYHPPRA